MANKKEASEEEINENNFDYGKPEIIIDPEVERRLLRKLDFRLISFAFFSYFTSNLVRNNMRKNLLYYIIFI
jgi:hypothetical protein